MHNSTMSFGKTIKLTLEPGKATPGPPVGPTLSGHGISPKNFSDTFNKSSLDSPFAKYGMVTAVVRFNEGNEKNKPFEVEITPPPTSSLIKHFIKIPKGSSAPGLSVLNEKISMEDVKKIAEIKMDYSNAYNIDHFMKCVISTATSMGIEVLN